MKLQIVVSTALMAMIAALSIPAQAAESTTAAVDAKAEQSTQASKPQTEASAASAKKHAAQDKSKHYHPRDGK